MNAKQVLAQEKEARQARIVAEVEQLERVLWASRGHLDEVTSQLAEKRAELKKAHVTRKSK